jgi:hypothetical protein
MVIWELRTNWKSFFSLNVSTKFDHEMSEWHVFCCKEITCIIINKILFDHHTENKENKVKISTDILKQKVLNWYLHLALTTEIIGRLMYVW